MACYKTPGTFHRRFVLLLVIPIPLLFVDHTWVLQQHKNAAPRSGRQAEDSAPETSSAAEHTKCSSLLVATENQGLRARLTQMRQCSRLARTHWTKPRNIRGLLGGGVRLYPVFVLGKPGGSEVYSRSSH